MPDGPSPEAAIDRPGVLEPVEAMVYRIADQQAKDGRQTTSQSVEVLLNTIDRLAALVAPDPEQATLRRLEALYRPSAGYRPGHGRTAIVDRDDLTILLDRLAALPVAPSGDYERLREHRTNGVLDALAALPVAPAVTELADYEPSTGHLHTCTDPSTCECAAYLYCVAQDAALAALSVAHDPEPGTVVLNGKRYRATHWYPGQGGRKDVYQLVPLPDPTPEATDG